jgi:hypothetical protein
MSKRTTSHPAMEKRPVFCRNPYCPQGHKAFATAAAFNKHLAMLPECTTFLMNQNVASVFGAPPQRSAPDKQARTNVDSSNKRTRVLRRHVVNELVPAVVPPIEIQHNPPAIIIQPQHVVPNEEADFFCLRIMTVTSSTIALCIGQRQVTVACLRRIKSGPWHY